MPNRRHENNQDKQAATEQPYTSAHVLLADAPEMTVSENVKVYGTVNFKRLFRVDGTIEGEIVAPAEARLIVGTNGSVVGDLKNLDAILVEGSVTGDIDVRSVCLRETAVVKGNIKCRFIEVRPNAKIVGHVNVVEAPEVVPEPPTPIPTKNVLMIIDPQCDRHDGGSVPIPGADEDSDRIANYINNNISSIDDIIVTLESRHRMNITHSVFWVSNATKEHPPPGTVITIDDVENPSSGWTPVNPAHLEHCKQYLATLAQNGEHDLTIWPEHCLIGTSGHSVVGCINAALQQWTETTGKKVQYVMKGTNCLTEMFSAFSAEVPILTDPLTFHDKDVLKRIFSANKLIVCGQELSSGVHYSVLDILSQQPAAIQTRRPSAMSRSSSGLNQDNQEQQPTTIYLMRDGCSFLPKNKEIALQSLDELEQKGVVISNFAEFTSQLQ